VTVREREHDRREIEKYRRAPLAERLTEPFVWLRAHPPVAIVVVLFVVGTIAAVVAPPRSATPWDHPVGDCHYLRTSGQIVSERPIGAPASVARVLLGGGAEQASCNASHGHEVMATVIAPSSSAEVDATCAADFEGYVGHPLAGSRYEIITAIPTTEDVAAGNNLAVCLVARIDGQWMDHPAKGSRE